MEMNPLYGPNCLLMAFLSLPLLALVSCCLSVALSDRAMLIAVASNIPEYDIVNLQLVSTELSTDGEVHWGHGPAEDFAWDVAWPHPGLASAGPYPRAYFPHRPRAEDLAPKPTKK